MWMKLRGLCDASPVCAPVRLKVWKEQNAQLQQRVAELEARVAKLERQQLWCAAGPSMGIRRCGCCCTRIFALVH